ncbi:Xaa-Pro dipeptidyl-peptidase [Actinomadura darangshiensis]|uniref:Xaa-Pro dipeptidyl-peptidase n=1 Tax=Actinomadura darangshiensis TaxID=705336 RepID=A0A4R5ANH1_9ACTN|nr:Xaa-Pro dipeptidyl-peptidase [Actinomadura darangshiensis]TDD74498.1 Xaa-Pro dipeptidyl-peptidase [Actinomadura darangshiensis]
MAVAVLTGAALAGTGGGATALARTSPKIVVKDGVTQPAFSYKDAIREHVYVESGVDSDLDGEKDRVNVDIIRPKETEQGLKVPVIMDESPYYDNAGRGNESELKTYDAAGNPVKFPLYYDNYFVPRGYAFLAVDMVGTTRSDGCPVSGGPTDVLGGKAVVDWLNGRAKAYKPDGSPAEATWTTGRTGMIGKSYDGTLANGVAATGVEGLETIVPISAISSWYDYSRMNGVKYTDDEQPWLADYVDTDPPEKCAAVNAGLDKGEDDATGNYNAYWKTADYRDGTIARASRVHASIFASHGVNDLNVKDDNFAEWWNALAKRGVQRKVWLSQRGHVDPFDTRRDAWVAALHRWFDHELQKIPNGVMREPRADIEVGPDQWITQRDWPSRDARNIVLRPGADGTLGLKRAARGAAATFTDAAGPRGAGYPESAMVADPTAAQPYRSVFVSAPLPKTGRLSGTPGARLKIKLDKPTSNLTALLVDYGDDTRVDYLGAGSGVRTLTTEDCHGESTPADDACYKQTEVTTVTSPVNVVARGWLDAQNDRSLSHPKPLKPGRYYDVNWETLSQEYLLKKGHRLALVVAGTDADYNYENPTGAKVTVDLRGSSVSIPVVAAEEDVNTLVAPPQPSTTWRGPTNVTLPVQERRLY